MHITQFQEPKSILWSYIPVTFVLKAISNTNFVCILPEIFHAYANILW